MRHERERELAEAIARLTGERDEARAEAAALESRLFHVEYRGHHSPPNVHPFGPNDVAPSRGEIGALKAETDRLRALLREVEWQHGGRCACCGQRTHTAECQLAAALKEHHAAGR